VTVQVRGDLAPWRLRQIHQILSDAAARLQEEERDDGHGDDGNG
jgi:hypothetical protein